MANRSCDCNSGWKTALLVTNEQGQVIPQEDGKPTLRLVEWLEAVLLVHNQEGQLIAGPDQKPVLKLQKPLEGLLSGMAKMYKLSLQEVYENH